MIDGTQSSCRSEVTAARRVKRRLRASTLQSEYPRCTAG